MSCKLLWYQNNIRGEDTQGPLESWLPHHLDSVQTLPSDTLMDLDEEDEEEDEEAPRKRRGMTRRIFSKKRPMGKRLRKRRRNRLCLDLPRCSTWRTATWAVTRKPSGRGDRRWPTRKIVRGNSHRISGSFHKPTSSTRRSLHGQMAASGRSQGWHCDNTDGTDVGSNEWKENPMDKWRPLRFREVGQNARRLRLWSS